MCRVLKLEIRETLSELQELLRKQKTALGKERVQALYLLKTGQVETVQHLAVLLGRSRITVHRWLKRYRQSGLNSLLTQKKSPGRPKIVRMDVRSHTKEELKDPQGFKSYEEVQRWLLASEGIKASYKVVHYKLKAKLKAPRPRSVKQNVGVEEDFKKNCHRGLN
ncbi:putative transposase [Tolypothrix sp. NIES-4075]|uniref:helix-turn-helix domain-containing protein n=1 Tax=Tolypothrix sp. NIES-4075 TaxID=2005459 RepID=UPI000B5D00E6|nr:helix-turn-helix domain-containing protein [Tolypothrix sp. NIES-4075]GAX45480.1 putative transposase [Tolypothrix sp. NIES-4075]